MEKTEIPDRPSASATDGLWFVFADGADRVALHLSPVGLGRVFLNDALLVEQRGLRGGWRYRFHSGERTYELRLAVRSLVQGACECTLSRDGETLATLASEYRRARPLRAWLVYLAGGIALGYLSGQSGISLWQLALAFLLVLVVARRVTPAPGYAIGTPEELLAAKHARAWRSGRSVPRWLRWLPRLARNVRCGARLVSGRDLRARDFRPGPGQAVLLALLGFGIAAFIEWSRVEAPREFVDWAVMRYATLYLLFLVLVAGLVTWFRLRGRGVLLCVALLSAGVWTSLALLVVERLADELQIDASATYGYSLFAILVMWAVFYAGRSLRLVSDVSWRRAAAPVLIYVAVSFGASMVLPHAPLWYTAYGDPAGSDWVDVDVEGVYYRQHDLLTDALSALEPQAPGRADVFFVGFASYASQDVFMKEVAFVRDAVARRLGSRTRSLVMINNLETIDEVPLANPSNLAHALRGVGERMDVDEDVLFLYLTSHGSANASLSVEFAQVMPNPLDAGMLRAMLDESGIKWRIVVISACYSGSFIDALRDDHTLVLTAAHAEHTSFGCSNDRELTYFAEQLFQQEWSRGGSLLEAFEAARRTLEDRETSEGYTYSDPQREEGAMMAAKLPTLEAGFATVPLARGPVPVSGPSRGEPASR